MSKKILIIEDEEKIAQMVQKYLEMEQFTVVTAEDGLQGLDKVWQEMPDLILLDLMLPEMSGMEVCREVRSKSKTPIIMLTAKSQEVDKLVGLELGADDYVTKPFSLAELTARIRAVLRRVGDSNGEKVGDIPQSQHILTKGDLRLDLVKYELYIKGTGVPITLTEFNILALLMANPGRVYSRLQILETALKDAYEGYERTIDTHISNLRKKLEDDPGKPQYILTVYGIGYKFKES